ncbi:MAG: SDR family NAD(P)-dependent oxidoreductase [Steroidobacteraceae bacterium]
MSQVRFDGRVAIVTGAGGGLGRTYAIELAKRGAAVVVNDLGGSFDGQGKSTSMADKVVEEIKQAGGRAVPCYDSVTTSAGGEAIVRKAVDAFGRIDILVNNAGTLRNAPVDALPDSTLDAMIEVHLKGAFNVTRPAFKLMKQQKYGRILFASSAAGMLGNDEQAAYGAAKAGVVGLMNVLSQEGRAHNVLCNALMPTAASRMGAAMPDWQLEKFGALFQKAGEKIGNSGTAEFVTPLVIYLVGEACTSTHSIYSATMGRFARVFIGMSDGWMGPRTTPASADDVAAHFAQICRTDRYFIPESLADEFVHLIGRMHQGE